MSNDLHDVKIGDSLVIRIEDCLSYQPQKTAVVEVSPDHIVTNCGKTFSKKDGMGIGEPYLTIGPITPEIQDRWDRKKYREEIFLLTKEVHELITQLFSKRTNCSVHNLAKVAHDLRNIVRILKDSIAQN
jgi:hypothetical protein